MDKIYVCDVVIVIGLGWLWVEKIINIIINNSRLFWYGGMSKKYFLYLLLGMNSVFNW